MKLASGKIWFCVYDQVQHPIVCVLRKLNPIITPPNVFNGIERGIRVSTQ